MDITPRENDCLLWIANGKTAAETAIILGIKKTTVTTHLESAKKKLGACTLAHAVAVAMKCGLLDIPRP